MFAYHFSSSVVCVVNLHNEEKLSLNGLNNWTVFVHHNTVCVQCSVVLTGYPLSC